MPRYVFSLETGKVLTRAEGIEFPNDEAACAEARSIISVLEGFSGNAMIVQNEQGEIVCEIHLVP